MTDLKSQLNDLDQKIGLDLPSWKAAQLPPLTPLEGRLCQLEAVDIDAHAQDLFEAFCEDTDNRIWTYLPYGPFDTIGDFKSWMTDTCLGKETLFYAIINKDTGKAIGVASYLRIAPAAGSIEVGHINYSPSLQRTPIATETMYLMMKHIFDDLGYRRYEWKCDALNEKSQNAAKRLGFQFEGIFRQATIYKNRNRDTAWFSILDTEWPDIDAAYQKWLAPENFGPDGQQKSKLVTRS